MAVGVGVIIIPSWVVAGGFAPYGTFNLPLIIVEAFGGGAGATTDFYIPAPTVEATGRAASNAGDIDLTVLSITATAGYPVVRGDGDFIVPLFTVEGRDTFRASGSLIIPIPSIFGYEKTYFTLPMVIVDGYGRAVSGDVSVSKIYSGVAVNVSHKGISTYNSYPFNSITYFNGKYYGATATGIYLLEGNKDAEVDILAKIKTGLMNLGNDYIKYLRNVWLTYSSDGTLAVAFSTTNDEHDRTEEFPTEIASPNIHEERVKCPRGLKARYYMVEIQNRSGADFDIEQISMLVEAIKRKLR